MKRVRHMLRPAGELTSSRVSTATSTAFVVVASCAVASCAPPTVSDTPDAGPETPTGPIQVTVSGEAEVEEEALSAAAVRALAGDVLVVDDATNDDISVVIGGVDVARGADVGDLKDAVVVDAGLVDDNVLVVAASGGLFTRVDSQLVRSPLDDAFQGVTQLASAPGALWIAAADGLYRYGAADVVRVDIGGVAVTGVTDLVTGAVVDGKVAVVVALADRVVAVFDDQSGAKEVHDGAVDSVAVGGGGSIYWAAEGSLVERAPDGVVVERVLPTPVQGVSGARAPGKDLVWVATAGGLIAKEGAVFSAAGTAVDAVVAGDDGDAIVVRAGAVARVVSGRQLRFNLADATLLPDGAVTSVSVSALPTRLGATVVVSIDDDATHPPPLDLDPSTLAIGPHTVHAVATYPDGQVLAAERVIFAGTRVVPTWGDDVAAISDAICARCHTPQGGAHLLNTSELWRGEIDGIIAALDDGLMPPGAPLSDEQRRTVRLWRATGMQE